MAKVLAISSQVVLGSVGLSIAVPALQAEGHDVLAVPTVLLSNHPGLGPPKGGAIDIAPLLDGVVALHGLAGVDAVFTGYFTRPEQVEKAAEIIRVLKPGLVVVDPILGDHGKLYVSEAVAHAIKTHLVPLATVLTPNIFELSWLVGRAIADDKDAVAAARALGRPEIIVTSVPSSEKLLTLRVTADAVQSIASLKRDQVPHGTGDYLAGLYLAHRLKQDADKAFTATMTRLEAAIDASVGRRTLEWQSARQPSATTVIGVDGCKGGWIAAIWGEDLQLKMFERFSDILKEDAAIVAVDMPIGLPAMHGRKAEQFARKALTGRPSSIFPIPSRASIRETDYAAACAVNLKHSDPPRKMSQQCFHLFGKLREVDTVITPELQARVREIHPELGFCAMNDFAALKHSKKTQQGREERLALLTRHGVPAPHFGFSSKLVQRDDVIDACAAAWSARRILAGEHRCYPETEERDERGLLMRIEV